MAKELDYYKFKSTRIELEDFFKEKVWKADILPYFKYALQEAQDVASSPEGPDGMELAHLRGQIEQIRGLLALEDIVLSEKEDQIEMAKTTKEEGKDAEG